MNSILQSLNTGRKTMLGVLIAFACLGISQVSMGQLLQQDFSSSTTVSSYVATTPTNGQFNAISTSGAGTVLSINTTGSNKLRFARTANAGAFSRTSDFSPTPTSMMYRFDLAVSGNSTAQTTAATWQVGSAYGTANTTESNANTHSRIGLNWTTTAGQFSIRDLTNSANSANFTGTQTITWVINNSGATLSYRAPDGTEETVGNDSYDLWIGTTKSFNDIAATTASQTLTDLKFVLSAGTGTVDIDNILIDPIPSIPTSAAATSITSNSFQANWATVTGVTGYRVDVATDAAFTSLVSGYSNLYVSGQATNSLSVTGLSPTTQYWYRVRGAAQYTVGEFAGGNSASQTLTTITAGTPSFAVTGTPTNHGTFCPGVSGSVVTYTITNSGTAATNVVVSSSDAQFVVSNLSSTSIAGSGGTATYDVVFTPSSAGAKSATISVFYSTSTLGTTSSLTGTGTTPVTHAVSSAAATAIASAGATLNGNVTALGVCPATTEKGFVYSETATNAAPAVGGTGVTKTSVASVATGAYLLALTGLSSSTGYSFAAYVYDGTTYTYGSVLTFSTTGALSIAGTTAHGSICPAVSATPQTYTITNSGGITAAGISVVSSDPQFVVSGLSSTSIAGSGGTATYDVTFTPSGSGAQSAVITVSSTTGGIASVTSSLSGTGITPVSPVIASAAASVVVNTTATLNGSVTTLAVCPATTQKGFVYAETAVNANPINAGTGVTTAVVGSPSTGAYTLGLTGLTPLTGYTYKAFVFDGTSYTYGSPETFTTLGVATQLAFGTAPPSTGSVATNLTTFTVQALRANSTVDAEYSGSVTLTRNIVSGSATLTGTVTVTAVAGVATFSAAQFSAVGTYTITAASGALTTVTSSNITVTLANATAIAWAGASGCVSGASGTWLSAGNWCGAAIPSSTTVAQFSANGSATTIGFNMNGATTGQKTMGAIEITNASSARIINNSSTTVTGSLILNGVVVNGIANVIIRNSSSNSLTIANGSSQALGITPSNATDNIINIDGTGNIVISAAINGSNPITKAGSGAGILSLTGINTYTGLTTVSAGTLQLNRTGGTTIPVTNSITVNGGTLKVTSNQTIADLSMSSGSLVIDAGATLTITGTYNITGGTISNLGTLNLNGGSVTFPGTGVTINNGTAGTMAAFTIASSGTVTLDASLSLTGTLTLTSGNLAIGANTLTLGGAVSRTSGNIAGGNTSTLVVNGTAGSLFFATGGSDNYLKALTIGASGSATLGNALNITAYDGVSAEGVLTVTPGGTLASGGFLTIKSNVNGTAGIAAGSTGGSYISGDVTVERYIRQNSSKSWRLLASNTSGQTINESWQENQVGYNVNTNPGFGTMVAGPGANLSAVQAVGYDTLSYGYSIFKYDKTTDNLLPVTNTLTQSLGAEPGFFLFIRGDRGPNQFNTGVGTTPTPPTSATVLRSTGTLFMGDQTAVSTGTPGYAMMRNPYPSRIDMRNIVQAGLLVDAFQVWDPMIGGAYGVGGYQTFFKETDNLDPDFGNYKVTPGGGSYGSILSVQNYIESGAAFFIQSSGGTGSAQVTEACKTSGSSNASYRPSAPLAGSQRLTYNVYADNNGSVDIVDGGLVVFNDAYSNAVDNNDVRKSQNFGENIGIIRSNTDLVVEKRQAINGTDTVFFNINQMRETGYRFDMVITGIDPLITGAVLQDKYTGTNTALDITGATNAYTFTVDVNAASKAADRFRVVFRQSTVVPVSFISIKAAQAGKNIAVQWNVASEVNVATYEVERSTDGSRFSKAGTVAAKQAATYNWLDENAVNGSNYYRIKSVDNNGQAKYSSIVKVTIGKAGAVITVSPNPVQGNFINIQFTQEPAGKYGVRLINIAGQVVYNRTMQHAGGSASQTFTLPSALVSGIYQLEILAPDNSKHTEKLIVNAGN